MPDISPRFSLTVPSQPDPFVTVEIADNWEALDEKVSGYVLGTAENRPSPAFANRGFFYFETNTGRMSFSTGSQWVPVRDVSSVFGFAVMVFDNESQRNSALAGVLTEGMLAYLKNIKRITRYDGAEWKVDGSDASELTTGTLPVGRGVTAGSADAGVPQYNGLTESEGMFYGGNDDPTGTVRINYSGSFRATSLVGDGSEITALNASALSSGEVPVGRGQTAGSSNAGVPKYNGTTSAAGMFYGGTTAPSGTTRLNYAGHLHATQFTGSGAGLTSVPAENLTGTINNLRIPVISRKSFSTNSDATLTLDFGSGDEIVRSNRQGTLTFAGVNYTAGITKTVIWNGGTSNRTVSFPSGWVFVGGARPTSLAANKRGALTVTCHGTSEAECTAAWSAQP
jgi:hypothetical protein